MIDFYIFIISQMNEKKPFTEYIQMYDQEYIFDILHRTMYEYAIMDDYNEEEIDDNAIRDFLYDNLQWKWTNEKQ